MSARDELIARAHARRGEGALLREIADELDVSTTTVTRWLDPAKAELMRERARQAKLARRVPCERCGRPLGYERAGGVCRHCTSDDAHARVERVAALYAAGLEASEIARQVALAEGYVSLLLTRLAHAGPNHSSLRPARSVERPRTRAPDRVSAQRGALAWRDRASRGADARLARRGDRSHARARRAARRGRRRCCLIDDDDDDDDRSGYSPAPPGHAAKWSQ